THDLQFFYTRVKGLNFPEFTAVVLLDGEQIFYYDSDIREPIPRTEWVQKLKSDEQFYWDSVTERMWNQEKSFKANVGTAMQSFNQTKGGIHTWQRILGCELDDDGTSRGYIEYACDGEDFMSLDLKAVSWSAAKPQAVTTESKWESTGQEAKHCKDFLRVECVERLRKFESYSRVKKEKKKGPEVSVFHKHFSSPEVVCHATGFFPKALTITWQKDGEDVHEDVALRETLPNQDGSFQKRSILKVPAEELQKHTYTCVVQHSSLEKELVREVPKGGRSDKRSIGRSDGGSDGAPASYLVGTVMAVVVLLAAVAGIVFWRKKSDFNRLPVEEPVELSPVS
ncbi:BOLA class I histocompatibility antigen, alpha chain BL3-7-like isoform X2, partial [Clarias magur]